MISAIIDRQRSLGAPGLSDGSPDDARAMLASGRDGLGGGPDMATIQDVVIPGRSGPVAARVFVPAGEVVGVMAYLHGGGWVLGALDDFDPLARTLADATRCAVVLPDYRLSPEHPFPAGLEDVEDAIVWAATAALPVARPLPLVVAGDSAGGNLATVALRRLGGTVQTALQVLIYPVTDCAFDTPSYRQHADGLPLTRRDMQWFFEQYAPQDMWASPDISPARAADVSALPPSVVITAEYDVLHSEGQSYAAQLQAAGVPTHLQTYPGVTHGFLRMHNFLDVARDAVADIASAVARGVSEPAEEPS
ncbi:alpha/beta hydrolase [Aeromicrobium sp. CFBP 8757]|uniref:alpha/beta hydrolase n=1 Tax=Aeromicrobium sp. CFBP 8757 TaxID=2775288 RepID=UPI00177E3054|nr:alpha/beta hydrolase [Aeromicrobium sp. CFBP 8757]